MLVKGKQCNMETMINMPSVLIWQDKDDLFWCEHDAFHARGRESTPLEADNIEDAVAEAQTLTDCREDEITW